MTEDFYFLAETLTKGGHIIVPERTYRHFPCGRAMIEMLCESVDLIIEAPGRVPDDVVVAMVRG